MLSSCVCVYIYAYGIRIFRAFFRTKLFSLEFGQVASSYFMYAFPNLKVSAVLFIDMNMPCAESKE